jgi:hypothetical protein
MIKASSSLSSGALSYRRCNHARCSAHVKRPGLGGRRVHAIRHSTGSWLNRAGVDVRTVAALLRHSSPAKTLNFSAHENGRRVSPDCASFARSGWQPKPNLTRKIPHKYVGESGIRTHGAREGSSVFKTDAFNRSAISPPACLLRREGAPTSMLARVATFCLSISLSAWGFPSKPGNSQIHNPLGACWLTLHRKMRGACLRHAKQG